MTTSREPAPSDAPRHSRLELSLRYWKIGLLAVCFLAVTVYILWTTSGKAQPRAAGQPASSSAQKIPVVAVPAKTADIGVYLTALGSVTPLNTVTVKSRVDGQLMRTHFTEGRLAHPADWLAELDPRPSQAKL